MLKERRTDCTHGKPHRDAMHVSTWEKAHVHGLGTCMHLAHACACGMHAHGACVCVLHAGPRRMCVRVARVPMAHASACCMHVHDTCMCMLNACQRHIPHATYVRAHSRSHAEKADWLKAEEPAFTTLHD
eukprot:301522-Chlamydomonas_euryale.AAC.11